MTTTTYAQRCRQDDRIVDRLYDRHLGHLAYKLSDETCERVWYAICSALGGGSRAEIRAAIDEAQYWGRELTP
jgi:hypothetical protein